MFLSFWGNIANNPIGGCCTAAYDATFAWFMSFDIYVCSGSCTLTCPGAEAPPPAPPGAATMP